MDAEQEGPAYENDVMGLGDLNQFITERMESDYDNQFENLLLAESQSPQMSFYSEMLPVKSNESFSSFALGESYLSENIKTSSTLSPVELPNDQPNNKHFVCSYENCKKSFKFKWILDRHFLSHKSAKLYKCTYRGCIKSYKSKENLTLHVKNIHLKEKPYSCKFCSSLFSHRNGKNFHLKNN
jgi:hypothetical protein